MALNNMSTILIINSTTSFTCSTSVESQSISTGSRKTIFGSYGKRKSTIGFPKGPVCSKKRKIAKTSRNRSETFSSSTKNISTKKWGSWQNWSRRCNSLVTSWRRATSRCEWLMKLGLGLLVTFLIERKALLIWELYNVHWQLVIIFLINGLVSLALEPFSTNRHTSWYRQSHYQLYRCPHSQ